MTVLCKWVYKPEASVVVIKEGKEERRTCEDLWSTYYIPGLG